MSLGQDIVRTHHALRCPSTLAVRTSLSIITFAPVLYEISPKACVGGIAYALAGTLLAGHGFGRLLAFYQMQGLQQEAGLRASPRGPLQV